MVYIVLTFSHFPRSDKLEKTANLYEATYLPISLTLNTNFERSKYRIIGKTKVLSIKISIYIGITFKEMQIRIIVKERFNSYLWYTLFKGRILSKMTILMTVLSSVKCYIQWLMILVCYYQLKMIRSSCGFQRTLLNRKSMLKIDTFAF